ncbi:insulin-like growth factor-binding protein complex acid labile subunit [Agrilus planipennis]|uniref:Insulin-like growth factor-binding protein complex acid labile subunit n=1 Tax=Agrilus planipennis TaxID=224129 RepID=A0A1W4XU08_AGRPL|nr:insulin-like growth factor-binding protein complex acid labile subunit [Agrilus planipennis]XP_018335960.1 insulin-like growth factor-binding protein complex acid labile subunit [Agrilus planipennis]XP_025836137.1 insulin-like growth factor-binding protein complex acid labile subunit [Agrilus planipennis]XP_025836138.1 insulin-like growth factor-binding protein complex acid labile subunit [Agrilus planipennis]
MKHIFVMILFASECLINASIPGCNEVERYRYTKHRIHYNVEITNIDLNCYGIDNLPSKELQFEGKIHTPRRVLLSITFHDSNIKTIPSLSFYEFASIRDLNLDHCGINTLETNCFLGMKNLKRLQLGNNNISKINVGTLSNLFALNYLNLSSNNLKDIDKDAFKGLTLMNDLLLNYNKLEELPDEIFSSLHSIRNIDLSWNNLSTLTMNIFRNMTSLEALKLNKNQLKTLPPTIFSNLSSLKTLDMSYNSLTNLSYESLSGLESLISLDISNNQLIMLDSKYNCHNAFSEKFSQSCSNESNVNTSRVSLFLGMKYLKELHLEGNNISKIENETLRGFVQLEILSLSKNRLTEIHQDAFKDLSSLTYLSLDKNNLETICNSTFSNLRKLTTLLLDDNKIRTLSVSLFKDLDSLDTLSLSNNLLKHLPFGLMSHLNLLSSLNISNNQLVELNPISFHFLNVIKSLDISNNKINTVDINQLMSATRNLEHIYLNGNNWNCEGLFNIIRSLTVRGVVVENGNTIDIENVHGIACSQSNRETEMGTFTTSERTTTVTNDFQKHVSKVLMNITGTLSNINVILSNPTGYSDEKKRTKDQNIQEGILNNSIVIVKLLESAIQQSAKNEQNKERYLQLNVLNKKDIQTKKETNDIAGFERFQTVQTTSDIETAKMYLIVILSVTSMIMLIIIGFTYCESFRRIPIIDRIRRISIIDRIRRHKSQHQSQSNADLIINNDVEILNTRI